MRNPLWEQQLWKYTNNHIEYQLWYNDINNSVERNRFTIAHEICHVINGDFKKPITKNDEKLCDYFAKCLLALQCLIISRKEFDINTIVTKYKVSKMVAENWLNAINNRIATFSEDCLTDTEKSYIKQIKKYYNHQPASNGL